MIDQAACTPNQGILSFHWEILFPPTLQSVVYSSTGITGYFSPVLTIRPSSLPALEDTEAGSDTFWRVRLTITEHPSESDPMLLSQRVFYFRFKYQQTDLTLQMSTDCQRIGHFDGVLCNSLVAANGLPATEPH